MEPDQEFREGAAVKFAVDEETGNQFYPGTWTIRRAYLTQHRGTDMVVNRRWWEYDIFSDDAAPWRMTLFSVKARYLIATK